MTFGTIESYVMVKSKLFTNIDKSTYTWPTWRNRCNVVVVFRLPRPMERNGVTLIFRSLQNCHIHHRRLESLEHFNVLYIYIYIILSTTVSNFGPYGCPIFLQGLPFLYTFPFLQVHFDVCYVFNVNLTDSFDDRSQCRLIYWSSCPHRH